MKTSVFYKNCIIRVESFQLALSSNWIPRYTLMRGGANIETNSMRSHHDRLDKVFWAEKEADAFALREAMEWVDGIDDKRVKTQTGSASLHVKPIV